MTVKLKHSVMLAVPGSPEFNDLARHKELQDLPFSRFAYGWGVICCIAWLRQKQTLKCADVDAIINSELSIDSKCLKLANILRKSTIVYLSDKPELVGGNLFVPETVVITKTDMIKAFCCLYSKTGIASFLAPMKEHGVNALCRTGLKELINMIDFPIPSLACLVSALGFPYVTEQPHLAEGIMISRADSDTTPICVMYGPNLRYYKILSFSQYFELVSAGTLAEPITILESVDGNIITNNLVE